MTMTRDKIAELIALLCIIRPSFGDVGTRDVDVARQQKLIDRAIDMLALAERAMEPQGQALPVAWRIDWPASHPASVGGIRFIGKDDPVAKDRLVSLGATAVPLYASQLALPAGPVPELTLTDDDICAFEHAIKQLEWIASGKTPSRDCDLGDGPIKANIKHAMMHAKGALARMAPAYARLLKAWLKYDTPAVAQPVAFREVAADGTPITDWIDGSLPPGTPPLHPGATIQFAYGTPAAEPIAWESTTPAYAKYITDARYQQLHPGFKPWFKPYRCSQCSQGAAATDKNGGA